MNWLSLSMLCSRDLKFSAFYAKPRTIQQVLAGNFLNLINAITEAAALKYNVMLELNYLQL